MNFYNNTHPYYCGIDLHARLLYICIIDQDGNTLVHKEISDDPQKLLTILEPYIGNIVVGVECMHCWYWVSDFCDDIGVDFILGHALYMKAIHGGKAKNDRIDSFKIAKLMRGGNFPLAYVYPKEMRATRDLIRRRMKIVRHGADLKGHITNTTSQYNLPPHRVTLKNSDARQLIQAHFCTSDPVVKRTVDLDMALIDFYQLELNKIERFIEQQALKHNPVHLTLLKTVNGIGRILALRLSMKLAISIVLHRFKSLHLTHV